MSVASSARTSFLFVGWQVLGLLLVLQLLHAHFYVVNSDLFPGLDGSGFGYRSWGRLRFDLAAIAYLFGGWILTYLTPHPWHGRPFYRRLQQVLWWLPAFLLLLVEMVDARYFRFAFRRLISSDIQLLFKAQNSSATYLNDMGWSLCLLPVGLFFLWLWKQKLGPARPGPKVPAWPWSILVLALLVVCARGGWQLRPLMPIHSLRYVKDPVQAPLITNAAFHFLTSLDKGQLDVPPPIPGSAPLPVPPVQAAFGSPTDFDNLNVVMIVLESFGNEFLGKGYTPFFDSLQSISWSTEWGMANGLRSTQGILAITASVPSLMEDPFMFSAYQNNRLGGLASCLGRIGYTTSFFHGANPGSMQFDRFAKLTGFQHFHDRSNYPNPADYDGHWGIWDRPFFQYVLDQTDEATMPFFQLIFSLSSHHPYRVEKWFEEQHPKEDPLLRSMRYTDLALRKYFDRAQDQPWFENTLFVLTADHAGPPRSRYFSGPVGRYRIPIMFYQPGRIVAERSDKLVSQIDLMPTVLDYLKYPHAFAGFGQSIRDSLQSPAVCQRTGDLFQVFTDKYVLMQGNDSELRMYQYRSDPTLQKELSAEFPSIRDSLLQKLQLRIDQHHRAMIYNQLDLKRKD